MPPFPHHIAGAQTGPATSPTPNTPRVLRDDAGALSPSGFGDAASASLPGKITKKRKSLALAHDDPTHLPYGTAPPTDADTSDASPSTSPAPPPPHRSLSKRLKRTSSRLSSKISRSTLRDADQDRVVVVVQPGGAVPPVPAVPAGVDGRKVPVRDDGYGGLGHEIF